MARHHHTPPTAHRMARTAPDQAAQQATAQARRTHHAVDTQGRARGPDQVLPKEVRTLDRARRHLLDLQKEVDILDPSRGRCRQPEVLARGTLLSFTITLHHSD